MPLERLVREASRRLGSAAAGDARAIEPAEGLLLLRHLESGPPQAALYEPVLCLVLQGRKDVSIGERTLSLGVGDCLLVSHDVPVSSRITQAPYLALVMDIDIGVVMGLRDELGQVASDEARARGAQAHAADPELIDALCRYLVVCGSPRDAKVLAPLVSREIHYRLLTAPFGSSLRGLVRKDSRASAIARAIARMRADIRSPVSIPKVARQVGMSASAFHKHFRSVTSTTPLQYVKDIRLLEAQRLLRAGRASITAVAFEVGYGSPSQFSREYVRKFGVPPSQDLMVAG
jgi:AraC-like DNA-binding protein